jgi:hypothetical protein
MVPLPMLLKQRLVASWYPGFKLAVFLLLIANTAVFIVQGTASEGLDSAAWLILLLLFELETAQGKTLASRAAVFVVHNARFVAGVAVVFAAIGYLGENDWLDAANAWLWIAVVVLLEAQIRFAERLAPFRVSIETVAAMLYLALGVLVFAWAWRKVWFDAYDAALWLLAFATIEMNLLRKV